MSERMIDAALNTLNQGVQIGMTARIDSECQGIDKEAHKLVDLWHGATSHR